MDVKRVLRMVLLLIVAGSLVLASCSGGGSSVTDDTSVGPVDNASDGPQSPDDPDEQATDTPAAPTATLEPKDRFPEMLAIHPDAYDFQVTEATSTYIYYVPMMVAETVEYLIPALEELGWVELGKPTIMGHLATLILKQDTMRLTVSMQDNERTQATRVQMLISK